MHGGGCACRFGSRSKEGLTLVTRRLQPSFELRQLATAPRPRGYWASLHNQRDFFETVGRALGLQDLSGWYNVSRREIEARGGSVILYYYSSLKSALRTVYPDYPWDPARFKGPSKDKPLHPRGYWAEIPNQKEFLGLVAKDLGVEEMSDWYKVSPDALMYRGGQMLFRYYPSMEAMLRTVYPDYAWESEKFEEKGVRGYFSNLDNQRHFMDKIGEDLGIHQLSDWYTVTTKQVKEKGGRKLFNIYPSLPAALKAIYPEHDWDESKFVTTTHKVVSGYWKNEDNLLQSLTEAEKKLGIKEIEDWFSVSMTDLHDVGFPVHVSKLQLVKLLEKKHPGQPWEKLYSLRGRFSQQKRLERVVSSLFPAADLTMNARKEAGLINPETGDYLELDIYIPSLKLGFEFQERHHYMSAEYSHAPLEEIQRKDKLKTELAKTNDITLIIVPCWWDNTENSLVATIKAERPDLLVDRTVDSDPIPTTMPPYFTATQPGYVQDIGHPVTACFFTNTEIDPTDWWVFEKYDGIRGFWNPLKKKFFSRNGKEILLPKEIVDSMPGDMFVDGEIWFGEGNFQEASKLAQRVESKEINWSQFKYMAFDVPNDKHSYEERYNLLVNRFGDSHPYVKVAPKEICKDTNHLEKMFHDIIERGGEGVILRDPKALMESGRSRGYLKHKKFRDAEAKIVGTVGNGIWECELPNGIRFTASPATTEFKKRWTLKEGDVVSFKHSGYFHGSKKPKFPAIYRLRDDLTWTDVVNNWNTSETKPKAVSPLQRVKKGRYMPKGHWRKIENRRNLFCDFAKEMNFDPLVPTNWAKITQQQLIAAKPQARALLIHYRYRLKKALVDAFPELEWKSILKENKKKGYWKDVNNVRAFFDEFAKEKGMDPLNTESWYSIDVQQVLQKPGGVSIKAVTGSIKKALKMAYPELSFAKWTNVKKGNRYWQQHARPFFDEFAKELGMDPLNVESWYSIKTNSILAKPGAASIRNAFGGIKKALQTVYPELQFTKWKEEENKRLPSRLLRVSDCRKFFDEFAKEKGFNPLDPVGWYSFHLEEMLLKQEAGRILKKYGGFKAALQEAYPEIEFIKWKKGKFPIRTS